MGPVLLNLILGGLSALSTQRWFIALIVEGLKRLIYSSKTKVDDQLIELLTKEPVFADLVLKALKAWAQSTENKIDDQFAEAFAAAAGISSAPLKELINETGPFEASSR